MDVSAKAEAPGDQPRRKYRPRPKLNSTLAGVLAHPVRCHIQTILDRRVASAVQISAAIGVARTHVNYHLRKMAEMGVIEGVGTRDRRGAKEQFFRGLVRPELSDEEYKELSLDERQNHSRLALQLLCADAGSSLAQRLLGARADAWTYRNPFWVDEEGWQELRAVLYTAKAGIENVMAAVVNRKAANPSLPTFNITTGLTMIETPDYDFPEAEEEFEVPVAADTERQASHE